MKTIYYKSLLVPFLLFAQLAFSQQPAKKDKKPKDSLVTMLGKIKTADYIDKSIDSFLVLLPSTYKPVLQTIKDPRYTHRVLLIYPDRPYLQIFVYYQGLKYTNSTGISKTQQMKDLHKEKVKAIEIWQSSTCINGCDR